MKGEGANPLPIYKYIYIYIYIYMHAHIHRNWLTFENNLLLTKLDFYRDNKFYQGGCLTCSSEIQQLVIIRKTESKSNLPVFPSSLRNICILACLYLMNAHGNNCFEVNWKVVLVRNWWHICNPILNVLFIWWPLMFYTAHVNQWNKLYRKKHTFY